MEPGYSAHLISRLRCQVFRSRAATKTLGRTNDQVRDEQEHDGDRNAHHRGDGAGQLAQLRPELYQLAHDPVLERCTVGHLRPPKVTGVPVEPRHALIMRVPLHATWERQEAVVSETMALGRRGRRRR